MEHNYYFLCKYNIKEKIKMDVLIPPNPIYSHHAKVNGVLDLHHKPIPFINKSALYYNFYPKVNGQLLLKMNLY